MPGYSALADCELLPRKEYTYVGSARCGSLSCVVANSSVPPYTNDGFSLPAGQNAGLVLGILREGIVPEGGWTFRNGSYEGVSQAEWGFVDGLGVSPASPIGIKREIVTEGPSKARAAGRWARGDRLIAADNLGRLASVVTLGLPAGTPINVVAVAEEPVTNPGDVAFVMVRIRNEVI